MCNVDPQMVLSVLGSLPLPPIGPYSLEAPLPMEDLSLGESSPMGSWLGEVPKSSVQLGQREICKAVRMEIHGTWAEL